MLGVAGLGDEGQHTLTAGPQFAEGLVGVLAAAMAVSLRIASKGTGRLKEGREMLKLRTTMTTMMSTMIEVNHFDQRFCIRHMFSIQS